MKRFLSIILLFAVIACNKKSDKCVVPPPFFTLFITKSAPEYQYFLNDKGEADKENVYFYQMVNNNEKKYQTLLSIDNPDNKEYALVVMVNGEILYTGKLETLYLKNKAKTYKIEFLGELGNCQEAYFKEMYIDGVKNNDFILIK
ncbi:hypothetical protein JMN10_00950 [Capnocytophaga genosp. AHN8471]|uniref:Lipoprotein n=1 Tax=Capnocytophaga genosp. AHN8471 TaxID=327574 RepID=A0ABS1YVG9_9FLAO|nr:hypothetical protein [Capnocytophaga genosp. AHN8471]MBM0650015.1 hypothetical protein [Capnocytophaga genosp. AHN8471]MBM0660758.1 hypothetical protein [Capnocytophaga genosp. AHN8471]